MNLLSTTLLKLISTMRSTAFAAVACFASFTIPTADAAGQTITTIPSDHAAIAGSTRSNRLPFTRGVERAMILHENWDLMIPNGRAISRIGYRFEENHTEQAATIDVEIFMGHSDKDDLTLDFTFANNYLGSPQLVRSRRNFTLPGYGVRSLGDTLWFDLDTPFVYDASKNLIVEFVVHGNSENNLGFDYYLDRATQLSPYRRSPAAVCQAVSTGMTPRMVSAGTPIGLNWSVALRDFPASQPIVTLISLQGLAPTGTPLTTLFPGAQPGCAIWVPINGALSLFQLADIAGAGTVNLQLPFDLALLGVPIAMQSAGFDPATPGRWVTARAVENSAGIIPEMHVLYSTVGLSATSGARTLRWGMVTQFDHN